MALSNCLFLFLSLAEQVTWDLARTSDTRFSLTLSSMAVVQKTRSKAVRNRVVLE
jgi:hypothetical protein